MNRIGKIQVFTGDGKGKTTAALGLAMRAIGRGMKVFMVQFLKAPDTSGEHFAAKAFGPNLVIKPMGREGFIGKQGPEPPDALMAREALEKARNALLGNEYDVIILDEINVALHLGLLDVKDVLELMDSRPGHVELVLTGRYAHPDVVERADSVFEMRKIKHHFDNGVPAREGMEY